MKLRPASPPSPGGHRLGACDGLVRQPLSTPPVPPVPGGRLLVPRDRLLRLPEVEDITGIKKSTIYLLMKQGKFPPSVAITRRMSAWPETKVLQWVQERIHGGAVDTAESGVTQ